MLPSICRPNDSIVRAELEYNQILMTSTENYIPIVEAQCPKDDCIFYDSSYSSYYIDTHHLSIYGSIKFIGDSKALLQQATKSLE
jgi:hypothetical protein